MHSVGSAVRPWMALAVQQVHTYLLLARSTTAGPKSLQPVADLALWGLGQSWGLRDMRRSSGNMTRWHLKGVVTAEGVAEGSETSIANLPLLVIKCLSGAYGHGEKLDTWSQSTLKLQNIWKQVSPLHVLLLKFQYSQANFVIWGTQVMISEYFTPSQALTGMSVHVIAFRHQPWTAAKHCTSSASAQPGVVGLDIDIWGYLTLSNILPLCTF